MCHAGGANLSFECEVFFLTTLKELCVTLLRHLIIIPPHIPFPIVVFKLGGASINLTLSVEVGHSQHRIHHGDTSLHVLKYVDPTLFA
jgi:hypothetical protein